MAAIESRIVNPLPQLIPQRVFRLKQRVDALVWHGLRRLAVHGGPLNATPVPFAAGQGQPLTPVNAGDHFGPAGGGWQQRWFRVDLPADAGAPPVYFHWECQGEATAYLDGRAYAGLDFSHKSFLLPAAAAGQSLWIDCGTYATGIAPTSTPAIGPYGARFDGAHLATRDPLAWKVSWDLEVFIQLVNWLLKDGGHAISDRQYGYQAVLDRASPLLRLLLRGLEEASDCYERDGLPALSAALDALTRRFPAESWQPVAAICPQTHIDLVWLWPEAEAERKGVHSLATMMRLLEAYPGFTFTSSQPALYRAIERRAPELAAAIKDRVREGRWESLGGFEVEPDTQLPCGEALARSLVIGQRKIAEYRNGTPDTICWLPDVFGYATCLPQILRQAGIHRFFTTKLRWSAITRFPYQSFVWRGSDGSEVLAQISTIGYTGVCEVEPLVGAAREYNQADVSPEFLLAQGLGDGGGGPTEAMCERVIRLGNLAGVPRLRWSQAEDFFQRLEAVRDKLPVYQGELYLEYHRGTYTTQGEFKRLYRRAEMALQVREAVQVQTGKGPIDEGAWQRLCFGQFHDAIPGSSIGLVYEQLSPEMHKLGNDQLAAAEAALATGDSNPWWLVWNPLPVGRRALVSVPAEEGMVLRAGNGSAYPTQKLPSGETMVLVDLFALGGDVVKPVAGPPRTDFDGVLRETSPTLLDNGLVRAEFDAHGQLAAVKVDHQPLVLTGTGGLVMYRDDPAKFGAWDIDHHSFRHGQRVAADLKLNLVEQGPLRATLRGTFTLGKASRGTLAYVIEAGSPWLKVELAIDWQEDHQLLKYHLPTGYRGRWARYGAPFGSVLRSQQPGGAAEEAMWEVPGSRWGAVIDDSGQGAAIVSEARYGYSCRDGNLGLSLLRAPRDPDPTADRGHHLIRFAVGQHVPRAGQFMTTAAAADALYTPVLQAWGSPLPLAPFRFEALGSLVPAWVLPAEGAPGGFVIRFHETNGERGRALVELRDRPTAIDLVDFHQRPVTDRAHQLRQVRDRIYELAYEPNQILSLLVR